jgi:DNA/RNA-binding domain of Phe-tRNA-synthetase-like protein
MQKLPFELKIELDGWNLFWAFLTVGEDQSGLADLRTRVTAEVRERFSDPSAIAAHPPVAAMRKLFRAAGCDPTRYRPASEALLRRLVKGAELPAIHPLVDVNNCLSAELAVPCCVMKEGSLGTSLVFRPGAAGESYESLRGPFNAEAKPLLVDENGPIDTPITGSERVKVQSDTERAWLVAYLPKNVVAVDDAWTTLDMIARGAGAGVTCYEMS